MICFFDTSFLVKRYVVETGSKEVDVLFDGADQVMVPGITKAENGRKRSQKPLRGTRET